MGCGESSVKDRERIDENLYRKLSDFAALHEMLAMVRSHRPYFTKRTLDEIAITESKRHWRHLSYRYSMSCTHPSGKVTDSEPRMVEENGLIWLF
jgi:hypothetical protein